MKNKRLIYTLIFWVLIILLGVRLIFTFEKRITHHTDELYSVGTANSIGEPVFVHGEDQYHMGDWYSGDDLKRYLTVDDSERFGVFDVIQNKNWDNAPANFEVMINLVFSLFPGKFSWSYVFAINFVFYIGFLFISYLISKSLVDDEDSGRIIGLCTMVFCGLSVGGTGAFTFLRMYGVMCFYSLVMILSVIKVISGKKIFYVLLAFSMFFGVFTHTLFVVFAFYLTLFSCLYLFFSKRLLDAVKLGFCVLASLVIFLIVYPFDYGKVTNWVGENNADPFSYGTKLRFAYNDALSESLGFYIPFSYANIVLFLGILFFVALIILFVLFLFRKEKWFKSAKIRSLQTLKCFCDHIVLVFKKSDPLYLVLFLTSLAYLFTVTAISPVVSQGIYLGRYFMLSMFPLIICFVGIIGSFWKMTHHKSKIVSSVVLILLLGFLLYRQNYVYGNPFVFDGPYDDEESFHDQIKSADVMVFCDLTINLYTLIVPMRDVNSFYFETLFKGLDHSYDFPLNDFYVLVDNTMFNDSGVKMVDYSGFFPGVDTTEDFVNAVIGEYADAYEVEFVRTFFCCPHEFAVYRVHKIIE